MEIRLVRTMMGDEHTEGVLFTDQNMFYTIEQPWRNNQKRISCVPLGTYKLTAFVRPSGEHAWILENKGTDVYKFPEHVPEGAHGRTLILIHAGNIVEHTVGCILPGTKVGVLSGKYGKIQRAVLGSTTAMEMLNKELDRKVEHRLIIGAL